VEQVSLEIRDSVVVAGVTGEITEDIVRHRHASTVASARDSGFKSVLFDVRLAVPPTAEVSESQRKLNPELSALGFRLAIVVQNTRMAYLARQTFFGLEHRIFYDDVDAAISWLTEQPT
jgi:hypothetical protein